MNNTPILFSPIRIERDANLYQTLRERMSEVFRSATVGTWDSFGRPPSNAPRWLRRSPMWFISGLDNNIKNNEEGKRS
jgi:hypothetical protein